MKKLLLGACVLFVAAAFLSCSNADKPYIAVVSKGEQHDFWQQVKRGSLDAAKKYNVDITFEGPPSETDVQIQVEILNNAIAKSPVAVALAALSSESVLDQLARLKDAGIPVVGFDSGVRNVPEGFVAATAATDNYAAAGVVARKMFDIIKPSIEASTESKPARVVVMNQDASSTSIVLRGNGFRDAMVKLVEEETSLSRDDIAVIGNPAYIADDSPTSGKKFFIEMVVPASAASTDAAAVASAFLSRLASDNIVGIFLSNEASVKGILAASNDGVALKDLSVVVMGFDAGASQKNAIRNGYFVGSITQDPYAIGYNAIELAYKAYKGEPVADIDTGAKFYNKDNMDAPDIAPLLYD